MKQEALFLPTVVLDTDGIVTVEFMGSFDSLVDTETQEVSYPDEHPLTDQFDAIIGVNGTSPVQQLRNLADYMERQITS